MYHQTWDKKVIVMNPLENKNEVLNLLRYVSKDNFLIISVNVINILTNFYSSHDTNNLTRNEISIKLSYFSIKFIYLFQ